MQVKVLLGSALASFALGFGLAWQMRAPEPVAPLAMAAPAPPPEVAVGPALTGPAPRATAQDANVDALWERALLPQAGFDAEDRLRKLARANPVALRSLLNRYSSRQPAPARELLMSVLGTVQTPEVVAFALRLAKGSHAADRSFGFALLQSVAPQAPDARALASRALADEQSPEVLVQALGSLQAAGAGPEESASMVAQLTTLAQHADPAVRSASIAQLGQWDKTGASAQSVALALNDAAPAVRQAAIFAIAQGALRSDAAKAALMGMVNNGRESREVRGSAMQALERFALSEEEFASFSLARKQLLGL